MSLEQRWSRVRQHLAWQDLCLDAVAKFLIGLGVGALFAESILPAARGLIAFGILMILFVKGKYWSRFWSK